ncbi:MAG: N,N-dimethylformamidase beta subunit family domain-containing protein [Bryobacteraceae bacterium]
MRIGDVSDEHYVALEGVALEFSGDAGTFEGRSRASGAVEADLPPGEYEITLAKPGYGGKRVRVAIGDGRTHHFRLLSLRLLGYAWPKWVRTGETAEFRVHSPEPYKLSLWRYGWQKEFVRGLGWFDDHGPQATVQITPDGDWAGEGVGWNRIGYGSRWHPQRVAAPERSGLYYFHATTASGSFFSFPWLVQPAQPRSEVAVLASTMTWNAYNAFGGRSNYVNQDGLPGRPTVHARQDLRRFTEPGVWPYETVSAPLSFERPELFNCVPEDAAITDPVEGRLESAMTPAEWRLLGWMEREGFEYDLYSETELHFGRIPLDQYRVLVLNTHPEYWTGEMFRQVKEWVFERGGKLLYLGGCGLYAEAEFRDDWTMMCCREGEIAQRSEPAASLLGVEYTHSGYQSAAPYRVLEAGHWVFDGWEAGSFGHSSLHERCPGGASGHELDKISEASPANLVHLAKGENDGGNGADMVMFETESGGAVFSAGSLCWPLSIAVDDGVSKVTANVLRRFLARGNR